MGLMTREGLHIFYLYVSVDTQTTQTMQRCINGQQT